MLVGAIVSDRRAAMQSAGYRLRLGSWRGDLSIPATGSGLSRLAGTAEYQGLSSLSGQAPSVASQRAAILSLCEGIIGGWNADPEIEGVLALTL